MRFDHMQPEHVASVYSGKPGCACGCRGKHSYNSQHVEWSSKDRGYPVTADDVNDKQVKRVLRLLQEQNGLFPLQMTDGDCYSTDIGNRTYIVYPKVETAH